MDKDILRTVGFSLPAGNNNSKLVSIVVEAHNKSFSINLEIKLSIQLVLEQLLIYTVVFLCYRRSLSRTLTLRGKSLPSRYFLFYEYSFFYLEFTLGGLEMADVSCICRPLLVVNNHLMIFVDHQSALSQCQAFNCKMGFLVIFQ